VVTAKKDDGTVTIDTDPMKINKYHRYANTTGLNEQEKDEFNQILDQIYTKENDVERLNDIQAEIDRLKQDPKSKNVVQYLRNQQAVLVRQAGKLPATYNWDEMQLKR
jgi:hypothetical protein